MEIRFWGTRGSLPASLTARDIHEKVKCALEIALDKGLTWKSDLDAFIERELPFWVRATYGTNTPCIEIREGEQFILCDAGTGLRDFGNRHVLSHGLDSPADFHIFLTHFHWDHIQGFPFFPPAYIQGNRITIYGCHEDMKKVLSTQQGFPFFPVDFKELPARIDFVILNPDQWYDVGGFRVLGKEQNHPGLSYGYRFERGGKAAVYATDAEPQFENDDEARPFLDFFYQADLLIFDAQYTFLETSTIKENWGHSNNLLGVELAKRAKVKHLCLYHNDPASTDKDLDKFLADTEKMAALLMEGGELKVSVAWDGWSVEL